MTAVDESAKLEIIETIGKALGLHEKPVKGRDPIQFAAGALLTMPAGLWAQATLVRGEPMGHGTLAGLGPAIRAVPRLGRFVSAFGAQSVPEIGIPVPLFHTQLRTYGSTAYFDVTADGQRFLLDRPVRADAGAALTLEQGWKPPR